MMLADIVTPQEEWDDINTTVSSLRLDTIVANGYNVSRTHAKELVERGMVRVNWTEIDRPDFMLDINYPTKFAELHHSTVLGTLINNGLSRDSFGDIISSEEGDWQIVATEQMARFITSSLDHVGKTKVRSSDEYRPVLTNFLNPRQRYILETLVNQHDELKIAHSGGYTDAESARSLIAPDYYDVQQDDFEIAAIRRVMPRTGIIDFTPLIGLLLLQAAQVGLRAIAQAF
ncbi:hypothetical protein H7R52_13270 [Weissella confusa]|uniref:RNA-binding S4 domain-containing protein n=1 Tax=Weissella confusa TaxID=1583 RepID=A0A923NI55_WEICO|nr:hypothetical protein [Weissella confusa]